MNKKIITAKTKAHLVQLIEIEKNLNGNKCNLNHIDVSKVTDLSDIFKHDLFNGDISKWNVSNVKDMTEMFFESEFNGDISKWDVSQVIYMSWMFGNTKFDKNIDHWDVRNVQDMRGMFEGSKYGSGGKNMFSPSSIAGLKGWKPVSLLKVNNCFLNSKIKELPYWSQFTEEELESGAIKRYWVEKNYNALKNKLLDEKVLVKRVKI